MSDELVKQARQHAVDHFGQEGSDYGLVSMLADRIEALERELEITKASLADQEAENIRLRESEKP